jgi:hypothetical protein
LYPQLTLYISASLLKSGVNEVIVFELDHTAPVTGYVTLDDVHQLGLKPDGEMEIVSFVCFFHVDDEKIFETHLT